MAQLPPKIPKMVPSWPDFSSHQRIPSPLDATTSATATTQNPSWVDVFLDFSSARRGNHRRSASDSIAFLEAPMLDECRATGAPLAWSGQNGLEFDRFDDEPFVSMFTTNDIANAIVPSSSNTSTPSDHNSINDKKERTKSDQKHQNMRNSAESDEVQSQCQSGAQTTPSATSNNSSNNDRIVDPKRVKRISANRQSAQRSRVRKLQYIAKLERGVTSLQAEVSVLSPRVAFLNHQRLLLNVDNSALKQRIAALARDKIFKDGHQEALKNEIVRLRQVYHQKNLKKTEDGAPSPSAPPPTDPTAKPEKEQHLLQV